MAISTKDIKILWANAAGRCAFPDCREKLCASEVRDAAPYTIGEMAHIRGEKPKANRYDRSQTKAERVSYENRILLCPTHHTLIDKRENEGRYSVDVLHTLKVDHEIFVSGQLELLQFVDKAKVARHLFPFMKENYEAFVNFGPHSEIARNNPESDAHGVWLSERLATIIPNNRRMLRVTEANSDLFDPDEQAVLARFGLHVRTYNRWVQDEITYEGVVRFPIEFEALISKLAHGRA